MSNVTTAPLTPDAFRSWITERLASGETYTAVGRSLGVSYEAVRQWEAGGRPSGMALAFAAVLAGMPVELAAGLPLQDADSIEDAGRSS